MVLKEILFSGKILGISMRLLEFSRMMFRLLFWLFVLIKFSPQIIDTLPILKFSMLLSCYCSFSNLLRRFWWLRHLTFLILKHDNNNNAHALCRLMCAESSGLFSGMRTIPGLRAWSLWMTQSWSPSPSVLRPGSSRYGGGCRDDVSSTTPLMRRVWWRIALQRSSWN